MGTLAVERFEVRSNVGANHCGGIMPKAIADKICELSGATLVGGVWTGGAFSVISYAEPTTDTYSGGYAILQFRDNTEVYFGIKATSAVAMQYGLTLTSSGVPTISTYTSISTSSAAAVVNFAKVNMYFDSDNYLIALSNYYIAQTGFSFDYTYGAIKYKSLEDSTLEAYGYIRQSYASLFEADLTTVVGHLFVSDMFYIQSFAVASTPVMVTCDRYYLLSTAQTSSETYNVTLTNYYLKGVKYVDRAGLNDYSKYRLSDNSEVLKVRNFLFEV